MQERHSVVKLLAGQGALATRGSLDRQTVEAIKRQRPAGLLNTEHAPVPAHSVQDGARPRQPVRRLRESITSHLRRLADVLEPAGQVDRLRSAMPFDRGHEAHR